MENNYKFPSYIEPSLRRKKKHDDSKFWAVVISLIIATLAYFAIAETVEMQAAQAKWVGAQIDAEWVTFCTQAMKDHANTGTAASEDLAKLCGV